MILYTVSEESETCSEGTSTAKNNLERNSTGNSIITLDDIIAYARRKTSGDMSNGTSRPLRILNSPGGGKYLHTDSRKPSNISDATTDVIHDVVFTDCLLFSDDESLSALPPSSLESDDDANTSKAESLSHKLNQK